MSDFVIRAISFFLLCSVFTACERCAPQIVSTNLCGVEFRDKLTGALLGLDSVIVSVQAPKAQQFVWFADTVKEVIFLPLNPNATSSEFDIFLLSPYKNLKMTANYNVKIMNNPPNCSFYEQIENITVEGSGWDSVRVSVPGLGEKAGVNVTFFLSRN